MHNFLISFYRTITLHRKICFLSIPFCSIYMKNEAMPQLAPKLGSTQLQLISRTTGAAISTSQEMTVANFAVRSTWSTLIHFSSEGNCIHSSMAVYEKISTKFKESSSSENQNIKYLLLWMYVAVRIATLYVTHIWQKCILLVIHECR